MKINSALGLVILFVTIFLSGALVLLSSDNSTKEVVPNIVGNWIGESNSISNLKLSNQTEIGKINYDSITFTLDILEQEGRLFHGIRRSSGYSEDIVGYIDVDGNTLHFTDHDGYMEGEILKDGTIKIGYLESDENTKVASLEIFSRD